MPKVTSTRVAIVATAIAAIALALVGWLLYNQQNSDEILAQTYAEAFLNTQSAAVRITNLAGLFQLGGEFADRGRDLFFGLDDDQQLAMFTDLAAPEQVGDDLQTVIRGVYTHLELENDGHHNALLQAMADDLDQIGDAFPDSRILCGEINAWLRGRAHFQSGSYQDAVDSCTQAIDYNAQNPATYLDRALAHTRAEQYDDALADLSHVIELDPDRQAQVVDLIQSHPSLRDYLMSHQSDFPTLAGSVE